MGLSGELNANFTNLAMVAIPLNNHSIAYTFNGNYKEDGKEMGFFAGELTGIEDFFAKLFLRQSDPFPY